MEQKTTIIYYLTPSGENPIGVFLDRLSEAQQTKVLRIFETLRIYGVSSIIPHIKKLTGTPLWEIRILGKDNIRVFYVIPQKDTVLMLHAFIKKKQKTPIKETSIALSRLTEWQNRRTNR